MAALVTHYALAHPTKRANCIRRRRRWWWHPAVANAGERLFQIFGRETFEELDPGGSLAIDFSRAGLPEPPPWKRAGDYGRQTGFLG